MYLQNKTVTSINKFVRYNTYQLQFGTLLCYNQTIK